MSAQRPARTRTDRLVQAALALAILVPLAVYVRTLARSVTFIDGGELAAAAAVLGIAHPPGYPLFTVLGHLFSLVPIGSIFSRVALLSAVAGAAATGLLFHAAWTLIGAKTAAGWPRWLAVAGTFAGALLFAFADTPWSQAAIVEVYALHGLLVVACLVACLYRACNSARVPLYLPGFLLGLGLAHHLTAVLLAPALLLVLAFAVVDQRNARAPAWRVGLRIFAPALLPLTLYLYLPIRSRMHPAVDWDYPETLHRLFIHLSAAQYRPILGSEGLKGSELQRFLFTQLPHEATLFLPILSLVGLAVLAREQRRALAITVPVCIAFLLYNMAYPIHDIRVYYLPVLMLLALWAAIGAGWIGRRAGSLPLPGRILFLAVMAAVVVWPLTRNFTRNDMSRQPVAATFAGDLVRYADPRGVIFSDDPDHFSEPMIYLQNVDKVRPDLVVLDIDRLESPMLGRNLQQWFPELGDACRAEIATVAAYASRAEHGLPFDGPAREAAYRAMLRALALQSVRLRPTYTLLGALHQPMFAGLLWSPEGMLVRLTSDPQYRAFPLPKLELPALLRGRALRHEEQVILSQYGRMLDGRVWYLEQHGHQAETDSLRMLRQALPR